MTGWRLRAGYFKLALRMGTGRGVDGCFGDFAGHDAIVAQLRRVVFQADDRIIPQRVRRLGHICGTRIRLGMGVAVHYAEHCQTAIIGRLLDSHVVPGIKGVDDCRGCGVAARMKLRHVA